MVRPRFIGLAFMPLVLFGASQGSAILNCQDCDCSFSCSATCFTDTGSATCGDTGFCSGGSSCGGGCWSIQDADFLKVLLQGRPGKVNPTGYERGRAVARLTWRLAQYVEGKGLGEVYTGETGFLVSRENSTFQIPALAFLSQKHLQKGLPGTPSVGTPDLVAEILSAPASVTAGRVRNWLNAGTRAVLVLDPQAKILIVHRSGSAPRILRAEDILEISDVVPGWTLQVGDLYE